MKTATMKQLLAVIMLLTIIDCSIVSAGSVYDACRREESRLRSQEADQCTGWEYVLNPSACFNTRKALAPYNSDKCRAIAISEGVVEKKVDAEKPVAVYTVLEPAKDPPGADAAGQPGPATPASGVHEGHTSELELLRREVTALRVEVERLRGEVARLREGR